MREALQQYVKRVQELAEHVRGNEQATRQSLVGPLFTLLGYDLTDPRECIPEHRVDFGPGRSVKPIDWAFLQNPRPIFFVEAKEVGKKLACYELVRRLLGPNRPVAYEDTVSYFKIHLPERHTWALCRLYLGRKRPLVWVPLPLEQIQAMAPGLALSSPHAGWTCITLNASAEVEHLGEVLRAAWDSQKEVRSNTPDDAEREPNGAGPDPSSGEANVEASEPNGR